jgi:hypothetical protein
MAGKGHVGKAGHLAAMAEFLLRGYNVAVPEVDVGDDIFVVHDPSGRLWRIQVKTAIGRKTRRGYRAKYAVGLTQLRTARFPDLFYVFALRRGAAWEFLVMRRRELAREHRLYGAGSVTDDTVVFTLQFSDSAVTCSGRDWQPYRNSWGEWPPVSA